MELVTSYPEVQEGRLIVAVDYGTTYTGVAVAISASNRADLGSIRAIDGWGPGMENHDKIPSIISYSRGSNQEWGAVVDPKSVAMVHTKLQLEVSETSEELDFVLQALEGMGDLNFPHIKKAGPLPAYTWKEPGDIICDYLTRMFDSLLEHDLSFSKQLRDQTPVDIVVTLPAGWSYNAKNSIFRALNQAGFNNETFPLLQEMLLVSEPEAAAAFTARHLKELEGGDFLRTGECFVLCDAGGGTVDVISYKVNELQLKFSIEAVSTAISFKCGSVFIDIAFKDWLRTLLGEDIYLRLDPAQARNKMTSFDREGEQMRKLMKKFDGLKRKFKKGQSDMPLTLPGPLSNLSLPNKVDGGQIIITYDLMKSFFEPRIDKIVDLIERQLAQVARLKKRCRYVFLVGGFAESPYLRESLEASLLLRRIKVKRPENSWTAVVRGATLLGIEKSTSGLSTMTACPKSYGISVSEFFSGTIHHERDRFTDPLTKTLMAKEQLKWFIKKGDVILSDQPKMTRRWFSIAFQENGPKTNSIPIFSYDYDDLPERGTESLNELTPLYTLEYDLSEVPLNEFSPPNDTRPFYVAYLGLTMQLDRQHLLVELRFKDRTLRSIQIDI